jgi:hypothetical protein
LGMLCGEYSTSAGGCQGGGPGGRSGWRVVY